MSVFILTADRLTKTVSEMLTTHRHSDSNGLIDMRIGSPNSSIVSNGLSKEDTQNEDENTCQPSRVSGITVFCLASYELQASYFNVLQ